MPPRRKVGLEQVLHDNDQRERRETEDRRCALAGGTWHKVIVAAARPSASTHRRSTSRTAILARGATIATFAIWAQATRLRVPGSRAARGAGLRPAEIMRRKSYPRGKRGHIVPAMYRRNFADAAQLAVHRPDRSGHQLRNVRTVGKRGPFYPGPRRNEDHGVDGRASRLPSSVDGAHPSFP